MALAAAAPEAVPVSALLLTAATVLGMVALQDTSPSPVRDTVRAATAVASARAARASDAPVIDARDNDPIWQTAPVTDQFREYQPRIDAASRFRTTVRIAYDDRALYLFARMYDPAPDSVMSLLSRRDVRTASDQFKVVIDSYHDRRTGFEFAVNPAGVKRDFLVYNDNIEDQTWDGVWDVATARDSLGWVAEFRIPFSQLRFPSRAEHTFGLLLFRDIARTGERVAWPVFRPDKQGFLSQGGDLAELRDIPTPRRLELSPYVLTRNVTRFGDPGSRTAHPQLGTVGADLKLGLSSNLTLDAAVNPDFGQVEADPSVLNLSAFEPFFEERRPFFLEGAGIFTFNTSCEDVDSGCRGLFYSRRIGRAPQLAGLYGTSATPQQSTIIGAAKLTGRTQRGLSVGLLDVVTPRLTGSQARTIEPTTNYAVARVQQDLAAGQSGVGAMLTSVTRDLDAWTAPWLRRTAHTAGVDARHRFGQRNYEATLSLGASRVTGDSVAMLRLQSDGVHRFQRPDDALVLDSARTALSGFSQRVSLSKFGGGITRFQLLLQRTTPGFESNDLGFQQRADEQVARGWFALQFQKPTAFWRRAFLNFNANGNWTTAGLSTLSWVNTNWHVELPWQQWIHGGVTGVNFSRTFDDRVARGGPAVRQSGSVNGFLGVEGDPRKPIVPSLFVWGSRGDEHGTRQVSIDPSLEVRAGSRYSVSINASLQQDRVARQWVRNDIDSATGLPRSLFARLKQTTFRTSVRLNVTATPTLSLQVWAQPFMTTGQYADLARLVAPRAARFADRWGATAGDPGGFAVRELRSNAVLRWEYRPGSVMFVVWQHGRSDFDDAPGRFALGPGVRQLFALPPNNTFLVKLSYWLNP